MIVINCGPLEGCIRSLVHKYPYRCTANRSNLRNVAHCDVKNLNKQVNNEHYPTLVVK